MKLDKSHVYNQVYLDEGTGPAVVLLHGLFGNVSFWKKTIEALKVNHRVIVPRLPIFGSTGHTDISAMYLVRVLNEFLEWHNLDEVTLVGHGIGGQVALLYAYYFPVHVQKIVVSGCQGLFGAPYISDSIPSGVKDFEIINEENDSENSNGSIQSGSTMAANLYRVICEVPKQLGFDSLLKPFGLDRWNTFLNRIDQPILLLWGMEDPETPPEIALHFYDFLHNSEVRLIEGCGHVPMIENPELFNHHLTTFLK